VKKIAIIGASYLQMPLVLKSRELGLQSHCFAWGKGAICKPFVDNFYPVSTIDKEQILSLCKKINIDGIVSIASDVAVPTVNYVASNLKLIGNSYSDSEAVTNKFYMRKRFKQNDVTSPQFIRVNKDFILTNEVNLEYPLIVKPVDRSGSRGVQKVTTPCDLSGAIYRARKESFINECIIEEYVEGVEVSVESISWEGKHFVLAITDKETTREPYFVEIAHHQPSLLNADIQENIKIETIKALNALHVYYGASHSEFIITPGGNIFVTEVGARMGGDFIGSDLVYLSTGYDLVKAVLEVALGTFNIPTLKHKKYAGVYFLSSEREIVKNIIENRTLPQIVRAELTDNELRPLKCSADRSGYFIYQSSEKLIL
jgi:biotin carboxylase